MPAHPMTADDLWALERVGAPAPAPDGSFAVVPVTRYDLEKNEGITRLYRVPLAGGEAHPLTAADVSSASPAISPDGRRLAFTRKPAGQDVPQLFVMPLDGGEPERLTDMPFGVVDPRWLPDGSGLVFVSSLHREAPDVEGTRARKKQQDEDPVKASVTESRVYRFWDKFYTDERFPHLFVLDADGGGLRDLTPDAARWWDFMDPTGQYDIAPDGGEIVFAANATAPPHVRLRWAIFAVPVAGGETRCLTPDNPADDVHPRYSPDGRCIVYGMQREWDNGADRVRLVRCDRVTGEHRVLTEEWDRSAAEWAFAADGASLLLTAEERGRASLFRLDLGGGTPERVVEGGTVSALRASPSGAVCFVLDSLRRPPEVYGLRDGRAEAVTHFNDERLQDVILARVEEVNVPGGNGDPIHTFVLHPPGGEAGPGPLVHMIHGGPHGTFGDHWHWRWNPQVFAAPGYVVALVNFHGSTSYGQGFAQSILGRWGDLPYQDVMAATDALIARGVADPARMAVTGGSYGGYMTAWITSQTDRFACAICHAGVTSFTGMFASDVTQGRARAYGAEPWEDAETAERYSPSRHLAGMRTPMLVIHGEKDYRVPVGQGLELYGVLKAKGVPARLVYYPDENHWILKPKNSLHWYGEVLGWLARYLKTPPDRQCSPAADSLQSSAAGSGAR